jgi:hypothetical protein
MGSCIVCSMSYLSDSTNNENAIYVV